MTEKSIYCPVCYSLLEQVRKPGSVLCPIHGLKKEEEALSLEDLLGFPKEQRISLKKITKDRFINSTE